MQENKKAYNPMDQIFRQKLAGYSSSYSPGIWDNIQAEISIKPNKRPAWVYWFLGILLLSSLILGYFLLDLNNQTDFLATNISSQSTLSVMDKLPDLQSGEESQLLLAELNQDEEDESSIETNLHLEDKVKSNSDSGISNIAKKINADQHYTTIIKKESIEKKYSVSSEINFASRELIHFSSIPPLANKLNTEIQLSAPKLFAKKIDPSDCPDFSRRSKGEMSIDLYYSSDMPLRTLSSINSEFDAYAIARDETEKELYSFSAGVRGAYKISPSLAIRIGLHYSQINERFNFEDPDAQQFKTIITIDSSFVNGMWEIQRDTQTIRLTGVSEIQHYNRYRMLDIPILLSYEHVGEKFDLALNGGIMLNILFKQKGRFLNPSLQPASFDSGDPNQYNAFKSNLGLSLYGSVSVAYKLSPQWSLLIEPNVRHYISPVTLNSYQLKQSYTTVGLLTGLRFHF